MIGSFRRAIASAFIALLLATSALAFTGSVKTLVSTGITTALSAQAQTPITGQDGVTAATIEANFQYGSGGASVSVLVQTTMDAGTTWRDVARFDFTTSTDVRYATLSGLTPKSNTAYVALAAAGVNDGLLGNQLRAVITSVGTYANTTLSVRASLR